MTTRTTKSKNRRICGVREAKTKLSQLLAEVQQGTEVLITDRGRPVGKLVGLEAGDLSLSERLSRLTLQSWVEAEDARPRKPLPPPLPLPVGVAQSILQSDRDG